MGARRNIIVMLLAGVLILQLYQLHSSMMTISAQKEASQKASKVVPTTSAVEEGLRVETTASTAVTKQTVNFSIQNISVAVDSNLKSTSVAILKEHEKPNNRTTPILYCCGWVAPENVPYLNLLFPNHTYVDLSGQGVEGGVIPEPDLALALSTDVVISSESHYPACRGAWGLQKDVHRFYDWVGKFPGKILVRNMEGREHWKGPLGKDVSVYRAGYYPDSVQHKTIRFRALQMLVLDYGLEWVAKLSNHSQRPVSSAERFMIFAVSNCVGFRLDAVTKFAEISQVDVAGKCGKILLRNQQNAQRKFLHPESYKFQEAPQWDTSWSRNRDRFGIYRFCLALENNKVEGYMTEKLLNAYLSGCIPIYYGSPDVFDIFNHKTFVYYDINNPGPAIARVRELEMNRTAFDEAMREPILANGTATVEEYFSFTEKLGGAKFVKKLHRLMELER